MGQPCLAGTSVQLSYNFNFQSKRFLRISSMPKLLGSLNFVFWFFQIRKINSTTHKLMEYVQLIFQIAIGVILLRLVVRNSILPVYISQWRSSVLQQLRKEK